MKSPRETTAKIVSALMRTGASSVTQLSKMLYGDYRSRANIVNAMTTLRVHGAVRIESYNTDGYARYGLQTYPNPQPDAPRPAHALSDLHPMRGRAPRLIALNGKMITIAEAAKAEGVAYSTMYQRLYGRRA